MKALILSALVLASCATAKPVKRATWEPVHVGLPGAVWSVTIDGHQYLLIARGNRAGAVHSEACPHPSHK